jgi:hypothetical protein
MKHIKAAALALGIMAGATAIAQPPANAAGPDLNGSRISWTSVVSCTDGGGIVEPNASGTYLAPNEGYYRLRYALERSDGSVIAYSPVRDWHLVALSATRLSFPVWRTGAYGYGGQAHIVAYAFKWNGSQYVLAARETLPCLGNI